MKIERIDLYHVSQPLVTPFVTSFGGEIDRQCLIVSMHSGELESWGECTADASPGYSYETVGTAWHILTDFLIPTLLANEFNDPAALSESFAFVRGHPLAKSSLDSAAWDLAAQEAGLPLAVMLASAVGVKPKRAVEVGVSIGIQPTIEDTMTVIEEYLRQGYKRIKLKIRPGFDLELARAARSAFPEIRIMLDANSAYSLKDAELFQEMDDLNLPMLEQPFRVDDIYDHSKLKSQIKTPLCLDESILSVEHARQAIELGACDIINIKPGRVGGLTEAMRVHDLCRAADVPVWCGGMLETGVGRAAQLALASLPGFTMPGDISATSRYYAEDIAQPSFILNSEDSTIDVPTELGLGVAVNMDRLRRATLRKATFSAS